MNGFRSIPGLALLASALAVPLAAQGPEEHGGHGERLGHVRFATSCRGAARREVEHGVAYLHSFWYERATETFTAAAVVDSSCAMAFWGQAMSLLHPLWTPPSSADAKAALAAIDRGVAAARTARERDYLGAIRAYYVDFDRTDPKTRLDRYALAMDTVQRHSPSDREAAIFYALALIAVGQANATDTTFAYQKRADSILEPLFRREPRHPGLAHYLIHTNDVPQLAAHGLDAARRYAEIAPDVPHAQHMPSHIFTRLGAWDDAIASNTRSAAAARAYEVERGLNAMWDQRRTPSITWRTRTCSRGAIPRRSASWTRPRWLRPAIPRAPSRTSTRSRQSPRAVRSSVGAGPRRRGSPSAQRRSGPLPKRSPISPARSARRARATPPWPAMRSPSWRKSRARSRPDPRPTGADRSPSSGSRLRRGSSWPREIQPVPCSTPARRPIARTAPRSIRRSEERRVGKECQSTC